MSQAIWTLADKKEALLIGANSLVWRRFVNGMRTLEELLDKKYRTGTE